MNSNSENLSHYLQALNTDDSTEDLYRLFQKMVAVFLKQPTTSQETAIQQALHVREVLFAESDVFLTNAYTEIISAIASILMQRINITDQQAFEISVITLEHLVQKSKTVVECSNR